MLQLYYDGFTATNPLFYMLFNKKGKKIVQVIWIILSIMVIISMTLLYMPVFMT